MDPAIILYALSLSAPLDAADYRVRVRAQVELAQLQPVSVWPAVRVLAASKSAEVGQVAEHLLTRWDRDEQALERLLVASIDRALCGKLEDRTWRDLHNLSSKMRSDYLPPREWVVKRCHAGTEKLRSTHRSDWTSGNWSCYHSERDIVEELAAIIWVVRMYHPDSNLMRNPNPKDW